MPRLLARLLVFALVGLAIFFFGRKILDTVREIEAKATDGAGKGPSDRAAPVEVARVEQGAIERRRIFSGTIEARAQFTVAARVGGRIERLTVDLADPVRRGAVVAELDDDEFQQAVSQAEANLAVAEANRGQAEAGLELAERELARRQSLKERGIATDAELDQAEADRLAQVAAVKVAEARITRARSEVATARTRLGYTRVTADWSDGGELRYTAERYVEVGDTVAANRPLVSIVEIDPIEAVVYVTEGDYGRLRPGQRAALTTEAFPGMSFEGSITRIAPAFRRSSRQARVELTVSNPDLRLKPGMFVRASVVLERVENATIVPVSALVTRAGETGVFLVDEESARVRWTPVLPGIRDEDRVQVLVEGAELNGRVVTLGHQLVDDGARIVIPASVDAAAPTSE